MKTIDVHSHFITDDYRNFIAENGDVLEDGFPLPKWSIEEHLSLMDQCGISWSLISLSSPQPFFNDPEASASLCRRLNEYTADLKKRYPDRIGFSAVLPLPDVQRAIEEAVYSLDKLGANGIKLASNSRGLYLGDPALDPLMEALNTRHTIVNIHPHRPEPLKEGIFTAGPVPLYEFIADTTRAVLNMISNGITERYPDIRWIIPHCGSFLPNVFDRYIGISKILVPKGLMHEVDVEKAVKSLYFDLSGTPAPHLLDFLLTIADPKKIMYGADFPFTPASMVESGHCQLSALLDREDLKCYKEDFMYNNAAALFDLR